MLTLAMLAPTARSGRQNAQLFGNPTACACYAELLVAD